MKAGWKKVIDTFLSGQGENPLIATKMTAGARFYFDLSTSVRWSGSVVGIVRVERELARRARAHLGDRVAFCVYDKAKARFLRIPDTIVDDVIHDELRVSFDPRPKYEDVSISRAVRQYAPFWREELSYQLLLRPKLYRLLQKARLRSLSEEDIFRVRCEREAALAGGHPWGASRSQMRRKIAKSQGFYKFLHELRGRSLSEDEIDALRETIFSPPSPYPDGGLWAEDVFVDDIELDERSIVISGGLDWEHKNIRQIYALKKEKGFKYYSVIYDLIPRLFPHFVVPGYDTLLRDYLGELTWLVDMGLCISETTRADFLAYTEEMNAPTPKLAVFPLGADLPLKVTNGSRGRGALPQELRGRRFGLYVSTIEPRKNHRTIYEAWDLCVRSKMVDPTRHCLVFVGMRGWGVDDLIREIEMNPATKKSIILLGRVPDETLAAVYRASAFNIFPSHYEGYGLPLAEAMREGKAVFASNCGSLAEIGGDLVVRYDPKNVVEWAQGLARAMNDEEYVDGLAQRVKSLFRPTTWDAAAEIFFESVTRSAADENSRP